MEYPRLMRTDAAPQEPPAPRAFRVNEHERYYPVVSWRRPVGPGEPHAFEDETGREAAAVDPSTGWRVDVTDETDGDGAARTSHLRDATSREARA